MCTFDVHSEVWRQAQSEHVMMGTVKGVTLAQTEVRNGWHR
jgi:hypothetical protein